MDTPNDKTIHARELRQLPTPAEALLWQHLRANQLKGAKFRRQMPIGSYFADFGCPKSRCIVEIDGSCHEAKKTYDADRNRFMEGRGWTVLRFTEQQVRTDIDAVLEAIGLIVDGAF